MKYASLLTLFVIVAINVFAEEKWYLETSNYFPSFQTMEFTQNNQKYGVIAGLKGVILTSTDSGIDWYGNQVSDCHWIGAASTDSLICCFAQPGIDNKDSLIAVYDMRTGNIKLKSTPKETDGTRITGVNLLSYPKVYLVNSNGSIYVSDSNFENWVIYNTTADFAGFVKYDNSGNLWKVSTNSQVYKSENNGQDWTIVEEAGENIYDIKVSGQWIYATSNHEAGVAQKVYCSSDSGLSWTEIELPLNKRLMRIAHCENRIFITFWEEEIMTNYVSNDDGLNWTELPLETKDNLLSFCFLSSSLGYAYGTHNSKGILYKYTIDTSVLTELSLDPKISLYPNPASNLLTIDMPQQIERVDIFSSDGKKILSSKNKQIELDGLPNGTYFIYIRTLDNTYTKQFIVSK